MQKKRAFGRRIIDIFNDSSPFMTRIGQICVLVVFNLLWLLCCLPVLTAGASSAALAEVLLRYPQQTVGSAFIEFFAAFRRQLRRATPVWLLLLVCGAVLAVDYHYLVLRQLTDTFWAMAVFLPALFVYGFLLVWVFPVLAAARGDSALRVLRNAGLLAVAYLGRSLLCAVLLLIPPAMALFRPDLFGVLLVFWLMIGYALLAWAQILLIRGPLQRWTAIRK